MTRDVSRQTFLRGALLAGGALLGGCRSTQDRPQATASSGSTPATPTTRPVASPTSWTTFGESLDGTIVMPTDGDYAAAKRIFNSRFDSSSPVAVVVATTTSDVQKAIAFAGENDMRIAIRAGGHSYIGDSTAGNTLVVDLRRLPGGITYDEGSKLATISAGVALNSVQSTLSAHSRSVPTGSCPTVGVAGLTLGGGLGADARRCGLTCDALVSATVTLPTGDVVTATPDDHADLYWALRGGGGGHFGVVTSFTFRTFPIGDRDVVTLAFPESAAAQALTGWNEWITIADHSVWSMVNVTASGDDTRCSIVLATSAGAGPGAAGDLVGAVGVQPVSNRTQTLNHMAFVDYFAGGTDATRPRSVVAGSDIIGEMTPAAADSVIAAASGAHDGSVTAVIESLSGAVRDIDPDGTAFPWRRQAACIQWYTEPSPERIDAARDWLTRAHETVGTHSVGGYVNYLEAGNPAARYFDGNLDRLAAVRQTYDPNSMMFSSVDY